MATNLRKGACLAEKVLPGMLAGKRLVFQKQPGSWDSRQKSAPQRNDLLSNLCQGVEGAKGHKAKLKRRERRNRWRVQGRCVAQKAARQTDQLLCKGLLGVQRITNCICEAVVDCSQTG